jgi:hypothetical protein
MVACVVIDCRRRGGLRASENPAAGQRAVRDAKQPALAVGNAGGVDVGAQGLGERLLPGQASRAARRTKMGNAAVCNNAEVRTTATSERSYNTPSRTLPANQATP